MIFNIIGETPSKKNSRIFNTKTKRCFPSERYTKWHFLAKQQVLCQELEQRKQTLFVLPIDKPCKIKMIFTHGDLIRRDSDNGSSSILDLLVDCGVLKDDNWKVVKKLEIENEYVKNQPSCSVEIQPI